MLLYLLSGFVDPSILISHQRTIQNIDFNFVEGAELQNFTISFEFLIEKTGKFTVTLHR